MGTASKMPVSSPTSERILDGDGIESACSVSDRQDENTNDRLTKVS